MRELPHTQTFEVTGANAVQMLAATMSLLTTFDHEPTLLGIMVHVDDDGAYRSYVTLEAL